MMMAAHDEYLLLTCTIVIELFLIQRIIVKNTTLLTNSPFSEYNAVLRYNHNRISRPFDGLCFIYQ